MARYDCNKKQSNFETGLTVKIISLACSNVNGDKLYMCKNNLPRTTVENLTYYQRV